MGRPATPHALTRGSAWTGLILAVSVLFSCLPLAEATDFGVAVVPPHPAVGQAVTLLVWGAQGVAQRCIWYRRFSTVEADQILTFTAPATWAQGPSATGRETLGADCSLRITGLRPEDHGTFTLIIRAGVRTHAIPVSLRLSG